MTSSAQYLKFSSPLHVAIILIRTRQLATSQCLLSIQQLASEQAARLNSVPAQSQSVD
jgi:hypothetical protein